MPEHLVPGTDISKMFDILNDTIDKANAALPGSKDSAGKISGDITGDAATVGGKKADGTAGNIPLLDAGGKLPLAVMPAVGNGSPGVTNYIASGGKVASVSGLTITHSAIEASISGVTVKRDAGDTQTVGPKRHGLLTIAKDGTRGIRYADDPVSFIDNNTVALWKPDGSVTCPNLAVGKSTAAVANDLTRSGGVSPTDGLFGGDAAKGDGVSGQYQAGNSTGIPTGAAPFEYSTMCWFDAVSGLRNIKTHGTYSANTCLNIYTNGTRVILHNYTTNFDTTFDVDVGKIYWLLVSYDGTTLRLYVNGQLVYSVAVTLNITAANFILLNGPQSYATATIIWSEERNALRTPQQIAEIANKMCFPNSYDDATAGKRKNITATLPVDTIALAYFRSGATGVLTYNDADWQYGRREKSSGGNRRVKLDWKAFGLNVKQNWANPFGTRKVKVWFVWVDTNFANETPCFQSPFYTAASYYGVYVWNVGLTITTMVGNAAYCGGACAFNGVFQTTGYVGCYAEVLEDD